LKHYNKVIPTTDILIRGDSGFATPAVYYLCELYENQYVIRSKSSRNLTRLAEEFVYYDTNYPWDEKEVYYKSVYYQATSWSKSRRICIYSIDHSTHIFFIF